MSTFRPKTKWQRSSRPAGSMRRNGALYMTVSVLFGVEEGQPRTTPISFVLAGNRLVTVRYATPKPIRAFTEHARRDGDLVTDAPTALVRMLDAIIDRLADELENVSADIEQISGHIFHREMDERRIPAARLTALLTRIGRAQTLLTKTRYSAVSTIRMLSFLSGSSAFHESSGAELRHHIGSLTTDVDLAERACQLPGRQFDIPARCVARADQHRAECGDETVQLGGCRVPAADADRRHFRHELPPHAGTGLVSTAIRCRSR